MSSCNTKPTMNPNSPEEEHGDSSHEVEMRQQRKQVKKQVRRRFHTSRPYQERLLNMAEARREIVAALKLHRATMRRASDPQLPYPRPEVPSTSVIQGSHLAKRYRIDANMTTTSLDHFNKTCFPPPLPWHYNTISPGGACGMFNSALPKPPLGLNLNFNDFEEFETTLRNGGNNDSPMLSFSPPSSYSCSSCVTASVAEIPVAPTGLMGVCEATSEPRIESSFHPVMDDKEMELIRSIGKQHDIEWNDKLNLVHSAWWCELLWNLEENPEGHEKPTCNMEGVRYESIDEAIGAPPCLSDQHVDEGCLHDATLPC